MNGAPIDRGIQEWRLPSWRAFHDFVMDRFSDRPAYIFRGQADAQWNIKSAIDRLEEQFPARERLAASTCEAKNATIARRDVHLAAFRQSIRGRPGVVLPPADDDECWALAQHHGLATPMLDWTLSPFVALFFAFEPPHDEAAERMVVAVSSTVIGEKATRAQPAPLPYIPPNEASYRLLPQSGLFLKMPPHTELENYVLTNFAEDSTEVTPTARAVLVKIKLPNEDRVACLKALNKMNINRMTLFPDADGAARYVNALWEIDFDTSLGFIRNELKPP